MAINKQPIVREIHVFKGGIENQPPRLIIGWALISCARGTSRRRSGTL